MSVHPVRPRARPDARLPALLAAAGALLAGCGTQETLLFVPLGDGVRSLLIVSEIGSELSVLAADASAAPFIIPPWDPDPGRRDRVFVLEYAETLETFGLVAGAIPIAEPNAPLARALPRSLLFAYELDPGGAQRAVPLLSPSGLLPAPLDALFIHRSSPCQTYAIRTLEIEGLRGVLGFFALDPSSTLIAGIGSGGEAMFHRANAEVVEASLIAAGDPGLEPQAVTMDAEQRVYLVARERVTGEIAVRAGAPATPLEPLPGPRSVTGTAAVRWASASQGAVTTLYLLDDAGRLAQIRGGSWSERWSRRGDLEDPSDLVWAPPDEVFVIATEGGSRNAVVRSGLREWEVERVASAFSLTALAAHPSLGMFAGTTRGVVYRRSNGQWSELEPSPLDQDAVGFVATADGFIYGDRYAAFAEYHDGSGFCGTVQSLPAVRLHSIGPFGRGFLALVAERSDRPGPPRVVAFTPL